MYNVVTADDEKLIREGLRDIVDWNQLGFNLVASFADGSQVIEFINNNNVDVVVTDIKMNEISGLDVSEYIFKNNLPIKVILISGYREIDLAMAAIKYNVEEYVLKPIDMDILTQSLIKVRKSLDKQYEAAQNTIVLETMEKSLTEIKESFFGELVMSSFRNLNYVKSMFRFLYPDLNIDECKCFVLILSIDNYDHYINKKWTHTAYDFYAFLKNFIGMSSSIIEYRMIEKKSNIVQIFGLYPDNSGNFDKIMEESNNNLCRQLSETLKCSIEVVETNTFSGITEMMQNKGSLGAHQINKSLMLKVTDVQKMLFGSIRTGSQEETSTLLDRFLSYVENLDIYEMQSLSAGLMVTMWNKLKESYPDISFDEFYKDRDLIFTLKTSDKVAEFVKEFFNKLVNFIRKSNIGDIDIIEQAKQYISENITSDLSLEDISEKFYMSQYYFSRVFKEKTGENFIDFVIRQKMEYAIGLLKIQRYKIYEVSSEVGYKSIRYFTKTFKNYTGYTPTAFRKMFSDQ